MAYERILSDWYSLNWQNHWSCAFGTCIYNGVLYMRLTIVIWIKIVLINWMRQDGRTTATGGCHQLIRKILLQNIVIKQINEQFFCSWKTKRTWLKWPMDLSWLLLSLAHFDGHCKVAIICTALFMASVPFVQ